MKKHMTNFLLALIFLVLAGILVRVVALGPPDAPMVLSAVAPYQGNARDGYTTTVNSMLVGGKTVTGGAQSFLTDTSGRPIVAMAAGNPLPVTITTPITVIQGDADLLLVNANVQQGDADVAIGNPLYITPTQRLEVDATSSGDVPITGTIGTIIGVVDVDATGQGDVPISGTIGSIINVVEVDATGQGDLPMVPFAAIAEFAVTELIGIDEQVAQYEYSEGTELALGGTYSGEILNVTLILSGTLTEAGTLLIFDADPSVTIGDANLATASWALIIGKIDIAAGDWYEENAGGTGAVATSANPIAFHDLSSLWMVYYQEGSTEWNSGGTDNESLSIQIEYRRDS